FRDIDVKQLQDEQCETTVTLRWQDEEAEWSGSAVGSASQSGTLRCAAEATVQALEKAVGNKIRLDLIGVKSISAFDAMVVVVSLSSHFDDRNQRLVGSCIIKGQPSRAVALAVLGATNRLLGDNFVYLR
ncbi:MAG: hypothetical protein ACE5FJ_10565, partial [Gemmatimonadales bacterium]